MGKGMASLAVFSAILLSACVSGATPRDAYSVAGLSDGFRKTVFGAEYGALALADTFSQSYVRRFEGPVRFFVRAPVKGDERRKRQVERFITRIDRLIDSFDAVVVRAERDANFVVHLVPRALYAETVRERIYDGEPTPVRGRCLVRARFTRDGISRSDAVIVTDEGGSLFSRCMTEEILQGLGPLNDDASLTKSIFNDTSRFTNFRRFDRLLLNMLYDRRIRSGFSRSEVEPLLPDLAESALQAVKR